MENEGLVQLIQQGINAKENLGQLYEQNKGLIHKLVYPMSVNSEMDDLMQEGFLGLWEAAKRYDPGSGTKFVTYAGFWITQRAQRFSCGDRLKKLPLHIFQAMCKCKRLYHQYGADLDDEFLKSQLEMNDEMFQRVKDELQKQQTIISLDEMLHSEERDSASVGDMIPADGNLEEETLDRMITDEFWECVGIVGETGKTVLEKRYIDQKNFREIGAEMGISRQRVDQLEKKALKRLRESRKFKDIAKEYGFGKYDSVAYRGNFHSFKNGGSIVEKIVIRREELQHGRKKRWFYV